MPLNSPTNDSEPVQKFGGLYVVATPIGNMKDITLRALEVLGQVDLIAAEDTRHTGRLLAHHKIKSHLLAYHEHNESERTPDLIARLKAGTSVALVSNAGTPSVSDPGFRLIQAAIENGIKITPIPGASAVITALCVAGMPTDAFVFIGFLSKQKGRRLKQLQALADEPRTIVFYEAPRRILSVLKEILSIWGDRHAVLCREMTKLYEEFVRGDLSEIIGRLQARSGIKGECTLLVSGCSQKQSASVQTISAEIQKQLETTASSLSELSKALAKKYGRPKNEIYDEALKVKRQLERAKHKAKEKNG